MAKKEVEPKDSRISPKLAHGIRADDARSGFGEVAEHATQGIILSWNCSCTSWAVVKRRAPGWRCSAKELSIQLNELFWLFKAHFLWAPLLYIVTYEFCGYLCGHVASAWHACLHPYAKISRNSQVCTKLHQNGVALIKLAQGSGI